MNKKIPKEFANQIYNVLVQDLEAREDDRENFLYHATEGTITEWRFCGVLGFGGKFWVNGGRWYVNCYREHQNPELDSLMDKVNEKLQELRDDLIKSSNGLV